MLQTFFIQKHDDKRYKDVRCEIWNQSYHQSGLFRKRNLVRAGKKKGFAHDALAQRVLFIWRNHSLLLYLRQIFS